MPLVWLSEHFLCRLGQALSFVRTTASALSFRSRRLCSLLAYSPTMSGSLVVPAVGGQPPLPSAYRCTCGCFSSPPLLYSPLLGGREPPLGTIPTRERSYAQKPSSYPHLVGGPEPLCVLHTGASCPVISARRGPHLVSLAKGSALLCLPEHRWPPQCLPGGTATRGALLVCLPHQRGPYPQALSGTTGQCDARPLRSSGEGALQRAIVCSCGVRHTTGAGQPVGNAAPDEARSPTSHEITRRA
jgi:hypothetical protein